MAAVWALRSSQVSTPSRAVYSSHR